MQIELDDKTVKIENISWDRHGELTGYDAYWEIEGVDSVEFSISEYRVHDREITHKIYDDGNIPNYDPDRKHDAIMAGGI